MSWNISSSEGIMSSMEAKWLGITAVAPVVWGANYVVTRQLLPVDAPLWGSALRALPAGLVLLAVARALPRGVWWWRSAVLGTLNVGAFFLLVYVAAQLLPSSIAASVMALAPLTMAGFAWLLVAERMTSQALGGAVAGILGVLLLVGGASGGIDPMGVAASAAALLLSSAGAVLGKRWNDGTPLVALTAWQLVFGGAVLGRRRAGRRGRPAGPRRHGGGRFRLHDAWSRPPSPTSAGSPAWPACAPPPSASSGCSTP